MEKTIRKTFKELLAAANMTMAGYAREYDRGISTVQRWATNDSAPEEARRILEVKAMLGVSGRRRRSTHKQF